MDPADVRPVGRVQVAGVTRGTPVVGLPQQDWPASVLPRLQSAYRVGHSTETAVLKVLSGHPARRRLICIGIAGSICGLRIGGSRHFDPAP